MNTQDGPPHEPVLTPVLSTMATENISTLNLLLDKQSKENRDRISDGKIQEPKSTDNQQNFKGEIPLASHKALAAQQIESLEAQISTSLDAIATEYGGTSGSELDFTSDLEFSSEDGFENENETIDDFVREVTNCCDRPDKNGANTHDLKRGEMEAFDALKHTYMAPASLPLIPTETTEVIFENEYFQVKRSQLAGWGAFAVRELKEGDKILVEKPLFIATDLTLFDEFDNLSKPLRDVAYSLYANSNLKIGHHPVELLIWKTNAFSTANSSTGYFDSEAGLFPIASRFNHACKPMNSVNWYYSYIDGTLEMIVEADVIEAGQELTISYDALSPIALYDRYGFQCSCGGCPGLSDAELAEREANEW